MGIKTGGGANDMGPEALARKRKKNTLGGGSTSDHVNIHAQQQLINDKSTKNVLSYIYNLYNTNPDLAIDRMQKFKQLQSNPNSRYYAPYQQATNQAVRNLAALGFDVSNINDAWFNQNSWLTQYYTYGGTTNSPTKPGKNASPEQYAAYEYNQLLKARDFTNQVDSEWKAMQDDLAYWANRTDLNLSDEEIVNKVKKEMPSKYSSLYKLTQNTAPGTILELNRGTDFSEDAMYGAIWAARNNGGVNNDYNIAMSALGKGNQWRQNDDIASRKDPNSPKFNPFSFESAWLDDAALYFGVSSFGKNWLQENKNLAFSDDETERSMYRKVYDAEQNTLKAEEAYDALNEWIRNRIGSQTNYEDAKKQLDSQLLKGYVYVNGQKIDISILNDMDAIMGKEDQVPNGKTMPMTRAVGYKYADILDQINRTCIDNQNAEKESGTAYNEDLTKSVTGENQPVNKQTEQDSAVTEAQDEKLKESVYTMGDTATPAEQAATRNMWSVTFDSVKQTVDTIKGGISSVSDFMKKATTNSVSNLSSTVLTYADSIQQFTSYKKELETLPQQKEQLEAELGNLIYYGAEKDWGEKKNVQVMINGKTYDLELTWDFNKGTVDPETGRWTGAYVPSNIYDENGTPVNIGNEYRDVIDAAAEDATGKRNTVEDLKKAEISQEEQEKINQYKDVVNRLDSASRYIEENQAAYDEAVRNTEAARKKYQTTINLLSASGVDTKELEDASDVTNFLLDFTQYVPTQWDEYNFYHEYSEIMYSGNGNMNEMFNIAKTGDEEIQKNIELGEWVLDYADRHNMEIPDSVRENVMRWVDALKRQHEDFVNLSVLQNEDFAEGAQAGRKMAEDGIEFDWDAYDGTLESQPAWNLLSEEQKANLLSNMQIYDIQDVANQFTSYMDGMDIESRLFGPYRMRDLLTDYEKDTFYYLLGTQGLEGANKYLDHLTDSSYGVLNTRAANKTRASADETAQQGFWGRRAADALSILLSPAAAIGSMYYMGEVGLKKLRGEKVEVNPNNVNLSANIYKNEARAEIRRQIDEAYKDTPVLRDFMNTLQEIISNRGDSFANMIAFGPLFNGISSEMLQEFMGALPMAFSAATDAVADAKANGVPDGVNLLGIFASTLIAEAGTEAISIDNIRNAFKAGSELTSEGVASFLKDWLTRSGISEMVGEVSAEAIETAAAEMLTPENSEYQQLLDYYRNEEHMSDEDAALAARRDQIMGILHTALVSYLSPGMDVFSYAAGKFNYYRQAAKEAQRNGNNVSLFDIMAADKQSMQQAAISEQVQAEAEKIERDNTIAETEQQEETAPVPPLAPDEVTGPVEPVVQPQEQGPIETVNMPEQDMSPVVAQPVDIASADYALLDSVRGKDASTQTAVVASVLDIGGTDESSDMAKAAAARADSILGGEESTADWVQDLILGAYDANVDIPTLKQAIQYAVLGGDASAAYQMMQTSEYIHADIDQKAALLASTVEQDAGNADVQSAVAKAVHENRVAEAERELILNGGLDAARDLQIKADAAAADTVAAQAELDKKRQETDAAIQAHNEAANEVLNNPTDDNVKAEQAALTEVQQRDESEHQYEQHLDNTKSKQEQVEANAKAMTERAMTEIRQQAEAKVAEIDQARAEQRMLQQQEAQKQAEARIEAERQQKIADQRSGKMAEDSARAKLERLAAEKGYTGEEAEKFVNDVYDFWSSGRFKTIDKRKQLSESESFLVMGALSRRYGVNVKIENMTGKDHGSYDPATNTITLDGKMPAGQIMVEFALHELTHTLEKTGAYQKYYDFVLNDRYKSEAELNDAVTKMMSDREEAGHPIDEAQAKRELVAEFTRLWLNDKNTIYRMVDAGLGGRIRNALHNVNQFLKNNFAKNEPVSNDPAVVSPEQLRRAERLLQKAIRERARAQEKARRDAIKEANTPSGKLARQAVPVTTAPNGTPITSELRGDTITKDNDQEYSTGSWTDEEKARVYSDLVARMTKDGMTPEEAGAKAQKWIDDVNSVASIVLGDQHRLDYEVTDPNKRFLKPNNDYYFTLDASTLCAKRLLFQGTFDTIQKMLPNTPLLPEDLIDLGNMMREMGYETPCGICYVESRRRWLGKYANEWLTKYSGDYIPTIQELTTSDGLESLRNNHPEAYESFTAAMNAKGSANPKVVQLRTDYRGDIMEMSEGEVQKVKDIGGLRIQSFSDFEIPHLIDMMQAVLDMSSRGLTSQAYTKVPAFAAVFGDTGIKINLSEIGKDTGIEIDNGLSFDELAAMPYEEAAGMIRLLYDDVEGMPHEQAIALRNQCSKNVGIILVGMNDAHIIAAMADGQVDFIIPFHKSGWSEKELSGMPVLNSYSDYTDSQNERIILGKKTVTAKKGAGRKAVDNWIASEGDKHPGYKVTEGEDGKFTITYVDGYETESFQKHKERTGESLSNFEPVGANQYWDFSKSGRENAENYLKMCADQGRVPKFSQFLVDNGDGTFSLPQGDDYRSTAIREGYWKTLIDFKMYDNEGIGSEQAEVTPNVNMDEARRVLDEYSLSRMMPNGIEVAREDNNTLPVAYDVAAKFVDKYKDEHPGREYSSGIVEMTDAERQQALRDAGIDTSAEERINRQTDQQEKAKAALDAWNDGTEKTVDEVAEMLGDSIYSTFEKWMHNTYDKGQNKRNKVKVTKEAVESFLNNDSELIKKGAQSLIDGWTELIENDEPSVPFNLESDDANWVKNPQVDLSSEKDVANYLFNSEENRIVNETDRKSGADFYNDDTDSTIRFNRHTVAESIHWAKKEGIDETTMAKVLMQSPSLLRDAKYIGSHPDYAHPNTDAEIHYLVAPAYVDGENRAVMFAIHDSVSGNKKFSDKAYVVEMELINKKDGALSGDRIQGNPEITPDLSQAAPSEVSITDVLNAVNTDRLRTFEKEGLAKKAFSSGEHLQSEAEMNQALIDSGILTQDEVANYSNLPGQPTGFGGAQRQFGHQTAQGSDALHQEVQDYLYTHSDYTPDTNQAQIDRSVGWVQSLASESDPDGYYAAVNEVTSDSFDYRSADGQARMLTVMGMAALKGDTATELRVADAYNKQGTDLGRQLQARKLFRLMTPIGRRTILQQEVARINQEYKNTNQDVEVSLSEMTLKAAESAQTEEEFQKVQRAAEKELAEQMPATWKEKLRTWRMLSMLANPRTHIRNVLGNWVFKPVVTLKNAIGQGLESAFVKEGGERTKSVKHTPESEAFAAEDVLKMKDTLTGEAKYSPENRIEQDKKAFGNGNGLLSRTIGQGVQALADFNSDLLEKEDWIFLNWHYRNALAGYMTANGLTAADMTGKTLENARTYAVLEAQKATYRDANAVSSWLNQASREGGLKGFIVDAVLPFKKTPANILRRGIEYSPIGLIRSAVNAKKSVDLYAAWEANGRKGDMPKGAKSLTQALDDIASGLAGTAIAGLGALLYSLGAVRLGFGGDDDDELKKERGSQEYSIELFGHSFTVDWAAPVCMPFFTGAALFKRLTDENANFTLASFVDSISKIAEPVFNLSMLDGVNSLLKTLSYSSGDKIPIGELAQKIGANYVGSFVPSLLGAAARTVDTTRRKNYVESGADLSIWQSLLEQVENKIPFLSMRNIPYRDVWGEADQSSTFEAFLENFLLPGYINKMKEDKVVDELQRLYDRGEEGVIPSAAKKTVGKMKLTDQQYDQYVTTRGTTAKSLLSELIETPEFIALTNDNPEAQAQLVKDVWEYANAVARHELQSDYKMTSWIAEAYASGDVVGTIFNHEETKAKDAYAKQATSDLFTAIDKEDAEALNTSLQGMKEAGKTDQSIRTTVLNHYRDIYKRAFMADDDTTMEAIRSGLAFLDLGEYSIEYGDDIFKKWEKDVMKKEEEDEE